MHRNTLVHRGMENRDMENPVTTGSLPASRDAERRIAWRGQLSVPVVALQSWIAGMRVGMMKRRFNVRQCGHANEIVEATLFFAFDQRGILGRGNRHP